MSDSFDYVIAGAGTAGCVLANRLSADAGATVALIEAGPPDDDPAIRVPAMVAKAIGNPRQSWGYQTVPQRHVNDRVLAVPHGRVLGGCSSINGMVYFRGHPREYDDWQQPGWRYADLLPYFRRLENYEAALPCLILATDEKELDPGTPNTANVNDYTYIAHIAEYRAGDFVTARKYLQKIVDEYPTHQNAFLARQQMAQIDAMEQVFAGTWPKGKPLPLKPFYSPSAAPPPEP